MPLDDILLDFEEQMEKAVAHLKHELSGVRTGRASPALVEHIQVDYYGSMTSLKSIAVIQIPEATQIQIKPFNPSDLKAIDRAISDSKLNLPTSSDGKSIRINLPPMSQDRRLQMVASTKSMGEHAKISIRNARRDANKLVDTEEKGKILTEDDAENAKEQIQELTKTYETKVDEAMEKKRHDILDV
ncbi:MAG: ribosome recycling factor [Burkholderiales bacterium]|nr:ribosome recycling factor [Phycisphaerae bacterium]